LRLTHARKSAQVRVVPGLPSSVLFPKSTMTLPRTVSFTQARCIEAATSVHRIKPQSNVAMSDTWLLPQFGQAQLGLRLKGSFQHKIPKLRIISYEDVVVLYLLFPFRSVQSSL
jgi:hypothetical protein